jgi:hypothetical protein
MVVGLWCLTPLSTIFQYDLYIILVYIHYIPEFLQTILSMLNIKDRYIESMYKCLSPLKSWVQTRSSTFNNISVIFWRSVLLVEETGVPGENDQPVASHWQTARTHTCWRMFLHTKYDLYIILVYIHYIPEFLQTILSMLNIKDRYIESMPITTKVVSSNPFMARCTQYNIMW